MVKAHAIFLFIVGAALFSCTSDAIESEIELGLGDIFEFGDFYDGSAEYYRITNNALYRLTNGGVLTPGTAPRTQEDYDLSQELLKGFPMKLIHQDNTIYGCPNCYDQGGLYLRMQLKGEVQKWTIDLRGSFGSEIDNYRDKMVEVLETL